MPFTSTGLHPRTPISPPYLQILMSSTNTSSAYFQSILDVALENYAKQTGIDLTKHPSADKLQNCRSPDDVLQILSERESAFKDYRDQYRNLIGRVRPVVQVIHAISAIFGEVRKLEHLIFLLRTYRYVFAQVPFQPTKAIFVGVDVLFSVRVPFFFHQVILIRIRLLLALVQAMIRLPNSSNVSRIFLDVFKFMPRRSRCHLRCPISWSRS